MEALEAIYKRRSIRDYANRKVDRETVLSLLDAAVRAPSAANTQPWAFAVIQEKHLLETISDEVKNQIRENMKKDRALPGEFPGGAMENILNPEFNIFYNATTLIIIFAKSGDRDTSGDCFLAGENLMLAALAKGLGTCPVGFAREVLNQPDIRRGFDIPEEYEPVLSIIVGYPKAEPAAVDRRDPRILFWK